MNKFIYTACAVLAALCLVAASARANVVVGGTRVVFPAATGEVTLRLSNTGDRPALVEAWIDTGDLNSTPDSASTPFLITPPLFRMEPHKDQNLRIIFTQGATPLPADRESLFWLNVLEIPPKPTGEAATQNTLQFAVRTRLKLFYRPAKLPGSPVKAADKLTFRAAVEGHNVTLVAHNPTPFFVTVSRATLTLDRKAIPVGEGSVPPFGTLTWSVAALTRAPAAGSRIDFTTIDDLGADVAHQGVVSQ